MTAGDTEFCSFKFLRNVHGFPTYELRIIDTTALRKAFDTMPEYDKADELIECINYIQQKLAELGNELEDRYGVIA